MKRLAKKGFTLIELLAVIVILAIILIIAVPSVTGLIDDAKKDSYISSAKMMVSSARLLASTDEGIVLPSDGNAILIPATSMEISLDKLPDGDTVDLTNSYVAIIEESGSYKYAVQLISSTDAKRGLIPDEYINDIGKSDLESSITVANFEVPDAAAETASIWDGTAAVTFTWASTTTTSDGTVYYNCTDPI